MKVVTRLREYAGRYVKVSVKLGYGGVKMKDLDWVKAQVCRKATIMQIGGFKPTNDVLASYFGKVSVADSNEEWPFMDGEAMHALCQINLTKLPYLPDSLGDIEFITVFIGPKKLPVDQENGINWCLRTYKSISDLKPIPQVETNSQIKAFQMKPVLIEDYPCREDFANEDLQIPEEIEEDFETYFPNVEGLKIGGWPTLIQSEIYWAPHNRHPAYPEYVFQIDSSEKGNWMWGDNGVGYFGRGTKQGHENHWAIEWQCY